MDEVNEGYIYASVVTDGDLLDLDKWVGSLGVYEVEFYLTGPLNVNTTDHLRYGYTLSLGRVRTLRDGFSSVDEAESHARLVMRDHDMKVSYMTAPLSD